MDKKKLVTDLQKDILEIKEKNPKLVSSDIARLIKCSSGYVREVLRHFWQTEEEYSDNDDNGKVLIESLKSSKKIQKLQDQQRIERKIREEYRYDNAISELTSELIKIFKNRPKNKVISHKVNNQDNYGIFHLSDTHLNELINIPSNQFDFKIASKRLQKMVSESTIIFKSYGIKNVLISFTGDLINSDRRLDELLNMATNRAKACALSAILFEQVILDLNKNFNVSIASVSGNEGRVKDEYGISEIMMSDNYDYTINQILRLMFRKNKEIKFIDGSCVELVVNINGKNLLIMHGHQVKADHSKSMQSIRGKYSDRGIKIDFAIYGHLHSALITDYYARSSSLCGSNAYSDNDLQFSSKASQNIHVFTNKDIHSFKIDLQDTENVQGYNIDNEIQSYTAKSYEKISWVEPKKI